MIGALGPAALHRIDHRCLAACGEALVLIGRSASVLEELQHLLPTLTAWEWARACAIKHETARTDFLAAHVLARHTLDAWACLHGRGRDLRFVQICDQCGSPHGKPYIPDHPGVSLSWSHQGGVVLAAVAAFGIGVDLEVLDRREFVDEAAPSFLGEAELAYWRDVQLREGVETARRYALRQWVRKESAIKLGLGSLADLQRMEIAAGDFPDGSGDDFVACTQRHPVAVLDWASPGLGAMGAVLFHPGHGETDRPISAMNGSEST